MQAMQCRSCGAGLPSKGIDRRLGVVTCEHCGSVHDIGRDPPATGMRNEAAPQAPSRRRERAEVAMPARFDIERGDGAIRIQWPKGRIVGAIVLGVFAVVWLVLTATTGLLPLAVVGLLLGYHALVRGINRVNLHVDSQGLVVRQGPLPWRGERRIARKDIAQLFAVRKVTTQRGGDDGRERDVSHTHYRVVAQLLDGKRLTVIGGLASVEQALWLEQEAERALGLRDTPVVGEAA